MATVIKMPVLGQSVDEVRILQWFKAVGDTVQKGERLAEIETDKTNIEWDSPESGVVRQILAPADSYVKVEAPIVIFGDADEVIQTLTPFPSPASGRGESGNATGVSNTAVPVAVTGGLTNSPLPQAGEGKGVRVLEVGSGPRFRKPPRPPRRR